jgi:hypothetical protein
VLLIIGGPIAACRIMSDVYPMGAVPSPNRSLVAGWYQVSGGGAAGWSEDRVRIRRADEPFKTDSDCVFLGVSADKLNLRWVSDNQLEIAYPPNTNVFKCYRRILKSTIGTPKTIQGVYG